MKILLIDGSAVCYMMKHALPSLSSKELPTSVIYGFLSQLVYYQKVYAADRIVFAFDSRNSKRTEIFPAYKAKRKAKNKKEYDDAPDEEKQRLSIIRDQFKLLEEYVLPQLGFANMFSQDGYEGDDIIASVCKSNKQHRIVIIANDADLFQLITSNHTMWHIKNREMITEEKVCQKYYIHPNRFAEMKSLAGCSGDEVPGIPGVGETKAIQYLCGDLKKSSVIYKKIMNSDKIIEFTKKLVVLPFEGVNTFSISKDNCTVDKFKSIFKEYGFDSMLEPGYLLDIKRGFCNGAA